MKKVIIYTDGACSGNPGPGGWGAILRYKDTEKEISGGEKMTTNNRMELTAVISALELLKESCEVELYSDSKYVIDALSQGWAESWRKKGWKTSNGSKVENLDLWFILSAQTQKHTVTFIKVKGHADHPENNRCDELARAAIDEYKRIYTEPEAET